MLRNVRWTSLDLLLSNMVKHIVIKAKASPVRVHAATKIVLVTCNDVHAAQYDNPSQGLKGKEMCVIQQRQTKCPGSTRNMAEETDSIRFMRGKLAVSVSPSLISTYDLLDVWRT